MKQQELESLIREELDKGYSVTEVIEKLNEEGVKTEKINSAVAELKQELEEHKKEENTPRAQNRKRKRSEKRTQKNTGDVISNIDLKDNQYKVRQGFVLNRYKVWDSKGKLVLKAKQSLFKLKEEIPFTNPEGNVVFTVKAESIADIAGDYDIVDEETGESVATLDKNFRFFFHKWKIRHPETESVWAKIESHSRVLGALRVAGDLIPYIPNVFSMIPHKYDVNSVEGEKIAELDGELSIRDTYTLNIEKTGEAPKEGLIAALISIDALEGN